MEIKAIHKETKKECWFDLRWGGESGHLYALDVGTERERYKRFFPGGDNRYPIDPSDYDFEEIK